MTLLDMLPSVGRAARPRLDPAIWPATTPSDEDAFRQRARRYRKTLRDVEVVYAGKSLLTTAVARWAREEGLGVDVCSSGELAVAMAGGVDPTRIIMHGNAKSPDELQEAVRAGVGRIVLDS